MAEMISDFGEKIGGARKDLAAVRKELSQLNGDTADISSFTTEERKKYIVKKEVFPVPDYAKMVESGEYTREAAYFIKRVRNQLPAKPDYDIPTHHWEAVPYSLRRVKGAELTNDEKRELVEERQEQYIRDMKFFQNALMSVHNLHEAERVHGQLVVRVQSGEMPDARMASRQISNALYLKSAYNVAALLEGLKKEEFLYSEEEKLLKPYAFFQYDGDNITAENDYCGKERLAFKQGGGAHYYYKVDKSLYPENMREGTTVVIRGEQILAINMELEDAKAFAIENEKQREKKIEKSPKARKQRLLPPQLQHIDRIGEDYRDGKSVTGDDMLQAFEFRGGEFGNWLSKTAAKDNSETKQSDAQANLNMSYEAFKDLAKALDISDKDISLGCNLAIAYGSRGHGGAVAHFETDRNVINLTKMRGAGSLAHEWGHALDYYLARQNGRIESLESEVSSRAGGMLVDLLHEIKYDGTGKLSKYFMDAAEFDKAYAKSDGYWQSNEELIARAFACYVEDKLILAGCKSDYLCGHATSYPPITTKKGDTAYTYPRGADRERINEAFDKLIEQLKEKGMLHEREPEKEHKIVHTSVEVEDEKKSKKPKESKGQSDEVKSAEKQSVSEEKSEPTEKSFSEQVEKTTVEVEKTTHEEAAPQQEVTTSESIRTEPVIEAESVKVKKNLQEDFRSSLEAEYEQLSLLDYIAEVEAEQKEAGSPEKSTDSSPAPEASKADEQIAELTTLLSSMDFLRKDLANEIVQKVMEAAKTMERQQIEISDVQVSEMETIQDDCRFRVQFLDLYTAEDVVKQTGHAAVDMQVALEGDAFRMAIERSGHLEENGFASFRDFEEHHSQTNDSFALYVTIENEGAFPKDTERCSVTADLVYHSDDDCYTYDLPLSTSEKQQIIADADAFVKDNANHSLGDELYEIAEEYGLMGNGRYECVAFENDGNHDSNGYAASTSFLRSDDWEGIVKVAIESLEGGDMIAIEDKETGSSIVFTPEMYEDLEGFPFEASDLDPSIPRTEETKKPSQGNDKTTVDLD
jgi:hypothetical protein